MLYRVEFADRVQFCHRYTEQLNKGNQGRVLKKKKNRVMSVLSVCGYIYIYISIKYYIIIKNIYYILLIGFFTVIKFYIWIVGFVIFIS